MHCDYIYNTNVSAHTIKHVEIHAIYAHIQIYMYMLTHMYINVCAHAIKFVFQHAFPK